MKKFLTYFLAVALVVGGGIAVSWPVPTWRLYDGNWQALAMTEAESYCAGFHVALSGYSDKPNKETDDCVLTSSMDNTTPSVANSQFWACKGVNAADPAFPVADCVATVQSYEIWFLLHGGFSYVWNAGNKYPQVAAANISKAPPRGEGRDSERDFG